MTDFLLYLSVVISPFCFLFALVEAVRRAVKDQTRFHMVLLAGICLLWFTASALYIFRF